MAGINRRTFIKQNSALLAGSAFLSTVQSGQQSKNLLWYKNPANEWLEALPVGNGRLGAMVFGGIETEHLQLNEDTLWAGFPVDRDRVGAFKSIIKARELIFAGQYVKAEELVARDVLAPRLTRSYETLGDLYIHFHNQGKPISYKRMLDLDHALASVEYQTSQGRFTRQVFASFPDQVIVIRLECNIPGQISFELSFDRPENFKVETEAENTLVMQGHANPGRVTPARGEDNLLKHQIKATSVKQQLQEDRKTIQYETRVKVFNEGGTVSAKNKKIQTKNANAVTLIVAAATTYNNENPASECKTRIKSSRKPFAHLRQAHIKDYQKLFHRVDINLGETLQSNLPTDERLENVKQGGQDPNLTALYFQYGRYLLISSSRPGSMPANLQGIWNHHMEAPWNCDYHININLQMNYWPAQVCNLTECHEPLWQLIEGIRKRGRKTARDVYNCRGFVAHHTTDIWYFTSVFGKPQYSMLPTGGAWICRHLWEYYAYTGDKQFLKIKAYPILKEACEFFLDWLVEDPRSGQLVSGPSNSPENRFITPDGKRAHLTMGPAMDQEIIWDLFTNFLESAKELEIDDAFVGKIRDAKDRLAGPKVGSDGRLMEWPEEFEEHEPGHRHISHLYALHPSRQITLRDTPILAAAARKSLDYRLAHGGGHTGWSRAWIINFWARFEEAEKVYENVMALLRKSTVSNLFDMHPPFQIDGNFGGTAGIAEALLQSHTREIHLLPALPKAWSTGWIKGLRARGGFEIDMKWHDGRLTHASVYSLLGRTCRIRTIAKLVVTSGNKTVVTTDVEKSVIEFETVPKKRYELKSTV